MKYLLIVVVVLAVLWLVRGRGRRGPPPDAPPSPPAGPQAMVRCAHCGVHLPANDALSGPRGSYCSADHRRLDGGAG
jgi:uncharacterized protein